MEKRIFYPIILAGLLLILIFNFFIAIYEYVDYQKRVQSGNDKWKLVEKRIEELEKKCNGRNG